MTLYKYSLQFIACFHKSLILNEILQFYSTLGSLNSRIATTRLPKKIADENQDVIS